MNSELESMIESFKQNNPQDTKPTTVYEALRVLSNANDTVLSEATFIDSRINEKNIDEAVKLIKDSIVEENKVVYPYMYSPYFTPEEVAEFKGYYSEYCYDNRSIYKNIADLETRLRKTTDPDEIADIKAELDALSAYSGEAEEIIKEATGTSYDPRSWNKKIVTLMNQLRVEDDPEVLDSIKQSIIDLGWNPEVDYTTENCIKATKRLEAIFREKYEGLSILDITSLVEQFNEDTVVTEAKKDGKLKPIHVVVVKGNSAFSNVITKLTNSQFSHSALCLDNDFNHMYSFNLDNHTGPKGGFSIENIDDYPKENRLAVFTFFVNNKVYKTIKERVKSLADNIKDTTYSFLNILAMPFNNINFDFKNSMICSQFVDSIMKMANMDITNKKSSHVVPNDFYSSYTKAKGKIYKTFDGIVNNLNPKRLVAFTNRMANKVRPYSEGKYDSIINEFLYPTVVEAVFPVNVSRDGDVLITKKIIDFDAEYSSSHKLLLQYAKNNNLEGMKYELARLYYMNYILEKRLYHNKYLHNKEKNIKTRARVLNDFKKYLDFVLSKEHNFNFGEYYQQSIFYPYTVEIKSGTVMKVKDILNYIL